MKAQILYKGEVIGLISEGETMTLHCGGELLTGDIVVRAIDDNAETYTIPAGLYLIRDDNAANFVEGHIGAYFHVWDWCDGRCWYGSEIKINSDGKIVYCGSYENGGTYQERVASGSSGNLIGIQEAVDVDYDNYIAFYEAFKEDDSHGGPSH